MPARRLQTCRNTLYLALKIDPERAPASQSFQSFRLDRARRLARSKQDSGENVMTAAAAATKRQAPLSNKARQMMESGACLFVAAAAGVMTHCHAPAQRP